jgi:hypothetical protein
MKRLKMGHKFSSPSFLVTMAFTQSLHTCLSFKSCAHMSVLWFILENCYFGEQNFTFIFTWKLWFQHSQRFFCEKIILICQNLKKKIQIARFLQQVLACSQNIQWFFLLKKSYLVYSQIWLNFICGWLLIWIHYKIVKIRVST